MPLRYTRKLQNGLKEGMLLLSLLNLLQLKELLLVILVKSVGPSKRYSYGVYSRRLDFMDWYLLF